MSARVLLVVLVWVVLACWMAVPTQGQTVIGRRVDDIPDPRNHPQECGQPENVFHSLLCDPDQILLHEAQQTVNTALMALAQQGTEVMVVLISQMDEEEAFTADHDVHVAAESMALALHDRFQSPGVLVFLSIADRAVYFSTSEPLQSILSSEDIAQTIVTMRPFLQQADYAAALQSCVESLRHRIRGDGVTPLQSTASSATEDAAAAVDQQEPNRNETSPSNSTATATATTWDPSASSTTIDEQTAPPPDEAPPSDDHDHGDDHSDDGDEDHFFFGGYGDDEPTGPMDAGDIQTPTPAAPPKASLLDDSSLKDLVRGGLLGTAVYCGLRTVTSWARHRRPPAARPAAMTKRPTMTAVAALLDRPSSSHAAAAVKPIGTSEANVLAVAVAQQAAVTSRSSRQLLSHRPSSTAATDVERGAVTDTDTLLSPLPWRAAAVSGTHKGSSPTTAAATTTTTTTTSASTVPRPSHQRGGGYWTLARRILHYVTPDPGSPATTATTTTAAAGTSKRTHFSRDEQSTDRWMSSSSSSSSHRSGTQLPQPRRRIDGDRW